MTNTITVSDVQNIKAVKYSMADSMHTTVITFEDDSQIYIFICNSMIFVADCDYAELSTRIDNDDTESFESYDTVDTMAYFLHSKYATEICSALLDMSHRAL